MSYATIARVAKLYDNGDPGITHSVLARTFGDMVAVAMRDGLDHYVSDLYHDAHLLNDHLLGKVGYHSFYFVVRGSGTHTIITGAETLKEVLDAFGDDVKAAYRYGISARQGGDTVITRRSMDDFAVQLEREMEELG